MSVEYLLKIRVEEKQTIIEDFPILSSNTTEEEKEWIRNFQQWLSKVFRGEDTKE